jgi:hypothetical protein
LSFFNLCFTIVDETDSAKSLFKNYTIGLFKLIKDDYASLKEALKPIVDICKIEQNYSNLIQDSNVTKDSNTNNNSNIKYDSKTNKDLEDSTNLTNIKPKFPIEWHLSGDYEFLNSERGHKKCSSNYPCFKCKTHKKDFCIKDFRGKNKMRTIEDSEKMCAEKDSQGYVNTPIFDFIKYDKVHYDTLHERIRILNKLIRLIYSDLIKTDNKDSDDINKLPAQNNFIKWLEFEKIRSNAFKIKGQDSKPSDPNISLKTFTGHQCKKICQFVNREVFSKSKNAEKMAKLLNDYWRIHIGYTKNFYLTKTDLLRTRTENWQKDFQSIFHDKEFTIYMHNLVTHVADEIEEHGNVDIFNLQG